MKLNLGCGSNKRDGYLNVDAAAACSPDLVFNLETFPWPWPDSSVEEAVFFHSLEHMGADPDVFLNIFKELYRVCAPGAKVRIAAPHPRHDNFLGDPTHVRPLLPNTLALFDREANDSWRADGVPNTQLAHYLGVDFKTTRVVYQLAEPYHSRLQAGELSQDEVTQFMHERNNVVSAFQCELEVRKP